MGANSSSLPPSMFGAVGLRNDESTCCWANAALQVLAHTPRMRDLITQQKLPDPSHKNTLAGECVNLLRQMWEGGDKCLDSKQLVRLSFSTNSYSLRDSFEFLLQVLEALDSCSKEHNSGNKDCTQALCEASGTLRLASSCFSNSFLCQFEEHAHCVSCDKTWVSLSCATSWTIRIPEGFPSIPLVECLFLPQQEWHANCPHAALAPWLHEHKLDHLAAHLATFKSVTSLASALSGYSVEHLQAALRLPLADAQHLQIALENCPGSVQMSRQLVRASKVLALRLDRCGPRRRKVLRSVIFPTRLNLGAHEFQLYATLSHVGISSDRGHFLAHCDTVGGWMSFNDKEISRLHVTSDDFVSQEAYVLFYRRLEATSPRATFGHSSHPFNLDTPNMLLTCLGDRPSKPSESALASSKNPSRECCVPFN